MQVRTTSPSTALVWELWRKNRWGFAALLILLGVCALISWQARRLQAHADMLQARNPNRLVIPAGELMAGAPPGALTLRVKLGAKVVYQGPVTPGDSLVAEGRFTQAPELRLALLAGSGVVPSPAAESATAETNSALAAAAPTESTNAMVHSEVSLYDGPLRSRELTWAIGTGPSHSVPLNFDPSYQQKVEWAAIFAQNWRESGLVWSVGLLSFGVLVIFGIFGAAEPHARLGFTGLPPRRYTLPVSTATLVAWPLGLGSLTMALMYLAWARIVAAGLLPQDAALANGYYTLLLVTGLVLFQALVWGLPSFPKTRAWLITLLVLSCILLAALAPASVGTNHLEWWKSTHIWLLTGLGVVYAGGIWLAWLAASLERAGAWNSCARSSIWGDSFRRILPRPLEFRSPAEALLWFEWRRNGRLALAIWTGVVCLLAAWDIGSRLVWGSFGFVGAGFGVSLVASFMWVAIVGLNLARDPASGKLALSSFTAVRPVSAGTMFQAKLAMAASLWVKSMIILGVAGLLSLAGTDTSGMWSRLWEPSVIFVAISLHVLFGILPLCLSGRLPGFPWSVLPLLLVYGALLNVVVWVDEHQRFDLLLILVLVMVVVKLVVAYWGFRRVIRLRLSSWQFVAGYVLFWLVAGGLLVALAWSAGERHDWSPNVLVWVPAAVLVVPLARIALSPLALAMNRHR